MRHRVRDRNKGNKREREKERNEGNKIEREKERKRERENERKREREIVKCDFHFDADMLTTTTNINESYLMFRKRMEYSFM